jgi:predicted SprT family Zn-dependent metalloprotease
MRYSAVGKGDDASDDQVNWPTECLCCSLPSLSYQHESAVGDVYRCDDCNAEIAVTDRWDDGHGWHRTMRIIKEGHLE